MVATVVACVINTVEIGGAHVELIPFDDDSRRGRRILESRRPVTKREDFYKTKFPLLYIMFMFNMMPSDI